MDGFPAAARPPSRKLLIIARDFLPYCYSLGGVIRVLKLAEYLRESGTEVFVLAARGEPIDYFGYEDLVRGLSVTYVDDPLQRFINRMTNPESRDVARRMDTGNRAFALAKSVVNEISVPDVGIYFTERYVRAALRIIEEHGIRNVMITSPPHSMQVVGLRLKETLGDRIRLIVDYRDSWNTTKIINRKKVRVLQRINERLERKVLGNADRFTHVSRPMIEKINARILDVGEKALLVMNGYDAAMMPPLPPGPARNDRLTIGHFGFIHDRADGHRNPEPILRALRALGANVTVHFYGTASVSPEWRDRFKDIAAIHGIVPHREAIGLMQAMDLLLIFHSERDGADEVVSGKIFEYMLTQKPILVAGPAGMEASRIVTKEKIGYAVDLYDADGMAEALREICRLWTRDGLVRYDRGDLKHYSRQYQYSRILEILE